MAKHDRRKRSSQPRSSRTVSIQVPLPVLGVLNGVREAFHGLCITTGMQVLEAMMEGDREDLCGPKGRHQAERPAWRGGSVASQVTLGGRQVAVPRLRVRRADGEAPLPSFQWAAATDPLDEHNALGGRRRGVDAAVCGHVGPGAGRGDGAGDVEQRGVSTVRGAVGQAPAVVSQPAVGRAGPAGGLHRRQGLPGALHRIPVNPDDVQESLSVRIRRQQRRQHRRPRRYQRLARPPDVQPVWRREGRHRRPLAGALDAERRDRQPAFDQSRVSHRAVHRCSGVLSVAGLTGEGKRSSASRAQLFQAIHPLPEASAFRAHRSQPDVLRDQRAALPWLMSLGVGNPRRTPRSGARHASSTASPALQNSSTRGRQYSRRFPSSTRESQDFAARPWSPAKCFRMLAT